MAEVDVADDVDDDDLVASAAEPSKELLAGGGCQPILGRDGLVVDTARPDEELPEDVARERFCTRLAIAALGVVEEKEKIRVVHDASHKVHVNHRIKVRDQIRCPGAGDIRTILRERVSAGVKSFGIMGDVSKAHRRVKVREQDWGYQACQLEAGKIWINKVGTYGIASAGYWWARFAAATLVRLCHYLAGNRHLLDILLYVDDHIMLACDKMGIVL